MSEHRNKFHSIAVLALSWLQMIQFFTMADFSNTKIMATLGMLSVVAGFLYFWGNYYDK